jgi:hypothetical protein
MSNQAKAEFVEEELSEQSIHDYLVAHPDFFERHSTLLSSLNLPHASGGAVSLVERQVAVLRQKDLKLERQLKELIEVARANDLLGAKIHELTMQLLDARDLHRTVSMPTTRFSCCSVIPTHSKTSMPGGSFEPSSETTPRSSHSARSSAAPARVAARFAIRSGSSCSAEMLTTSGQLRSCHWAKGPNSVFSPLAALTAIASIPV